MYYTVQRTADIRTEKSECRPYRNLLDWDVLGLIFYVERSTLTLLTIFDENIQAFLHPSAFHHRRFA